MYNTFAKVKAIAQREPFTTNDGRTIYATDVTITVPECRMSQMGGVYLKGHTIQCSLMSEMAGMNAPAVDHFICAEISINASYSQEKDTFFNRVTLNKWVDLQTVNWTWQ